MKIAPVNLNIIPLHTYNNVGFSGNKKKESNVVVDANGKEYVKIPKKKYDLENWTLGILAVIAVIQGIYSLVNKKPEPWEDAYRELKGSLQSNNSTMKK